MTSGFPVGIEAAVSVESTIRFPTHPMNVDVGETVEVLTKGVVFDHVAPQHHRPFFTGGAQGFSDVTYLYGMGAGGTSIKKETPKRESAAAHIRDSCAGLLSFSSTRTTGSFLDHLIIEMMPSLTRARGRSSSPSLGARDLARRTVARLPTLGRSVLISMARRKLYNFYIDPELAEGLKALKNKTGASE